MRLPPYGRDVQTGACSRPYKLLLFAGPRAWNAAKWYRERSALCERRESHTLVLSPDQTAHAGTYHWPVRGRAVVIVSTCANDAELLPLFDALQRDGAASIELYACDATIGAANLEFELLCVHWGHPFADPAVAPARPAVAA